MINLKVFLILQFIFRSGRDQRVHERPHQNDRQHEHLN
jgi:hypothetical protein